LKIISIHERGFNLGNVKKAKISETIEKFIDLHKGFSSWSYASLEWWLFLSTKNMVSARG
jgi:hypothetical protein